METGWRPNNWADVKVYYDLKEAVLREAEARIEVYNEHVKALHVYVENVGGKLPSVKDAPNIEDIMENGW